MKSIVIYNSQTGFTQQYAQWIADECGADCRPLSQVKKLSLSEYDTIVFGGFVCAATISKIDWFKQRLDRWEGRQLIAFCVGGSPLESPDVEVMLSRVFSEQERERVSVFYCPGGINYEKMPLPSLAIMRMFAKAVGAKKNPTDAERAMAKMLNSSYDISDKKYIQPIVDCINSANKQ